MADEFELKVQRVYTFIDSHDEPEILKLRDMLLLYAAYVKNNRRPPATVTTGILGGVAGLCVALGFDAPQNELPKIVTRVTQNIILNASTEDLDKAENSLPID